MSDGAAPMGSVGRDPLSGRMRLRRTSRWRRPSVVIVGLFAAMIFVGTLLLLLPAARAGDGSASYSAALFTSTSAVCVVGLSTVDIPTYWTGFGQFIIGLLVQVGGFGITTLASLFALLVSRRLGLRTRLTAQAESGALDLGDVRRVLKGVAVISLVVESITAVMLTSRFAVAYDEPLPDAIGLGVFHSVAAYNNAGFALFSNSLMDFVGDPWICLPISVAIIIGGLGFPVIFELLREWRGPRRWSTHTRLTVWTSAVLIVIGMVLIAAFEWSNPSTMAPLSTPTKMLAAFFASVNPRSAGFNSLDVAGMEPDTLLVTDILMLIGGGAASTAGGIKVTTFAILGYAIIAEMRGDADTNVFQRRMPTTALRQAVAVALLYIGVLAIGTLVMLRLTDAPLDEVLFETSSALSTAGLSTGLVNESSVGAEIVLTVLMFIGRLGPVTLASAVALRQRPQRYRLPEERPIIG